MSAAFQKKGSKQTQRRGSKKKKKKGNQKNKNHKRKIFEKQSRKHVTKFRLEDQLNDDKADFNFFEDSRFNHLDADSDESAENMLRKEDMDVVREKRRIENLNHKITSIEFIKRPQRVINKREKQKKEKKTTVKNSLLLRTLNDSHVMSDENDKKKTESKKHKKSKNQRKRNLTKSKESDEHEKMKSKNKIELPDYYRKHWFETRWEHEIDEIKPVMLARKSNNNGTSQMIRIRLSKKCEKVERKSKNSKWNASQLKYVCLMDASDTFNSNNWILNKKKLHLSPVWHRNLQSKIIHKCKTINAFQSMFASALLTYRDLWFSDYNFENHRALRYLTVMHCVNHILRNKDTVTLNNQSKDKDKDKDQESKSEIELRDSAFRNTRVLVITPFRETVRLFAESILSCLPSAMTRLNERYTRFKEEFGTDQLSKESRVRGRGKEFEETFAGNIDDDFWCGITITQHGVRFHQNWEDSDLIFISPLRFKMTCANEALVIKDKLSSIEILCLDHVDIIESQNIQHLFDRTLSLLNHRPSNCKNIDYSRLRFSYIDGVSQYYRQNIMLSAFLTPNSKRIWDTFFNNIFGRIHIRCLFKGVLSNIIPNTKQIFKKLINSNMKVSNLSDLKMDYFKKYILNLFRKQKREKTLIFVSDYFHFLSLRQLYANVDSVRFLSEYSDEKDEKHIKSAFFSKSTECMFLITSERYYFYQRLPLHGAQRVVFYDLPMHPSYFVDVLNWLDSSKHRAQAYQCHILYSKYDAFALERIVGTQRMQKMIQSKEDTHIFM